MMIRAAGFWRVAVLAVVLVAGLGKAGDTLACYARAGCRASVEQSLRALEEDGASLNSLDRFILRLILAESKTAPRK